VILRICFLLFLASANPSLAQDEHSWAEVHAQDEAKWAQQTGLSPFSVHQLWRLSSHFSNAADDDSRIQLLDTSRLGRNHILLVTYAGSDYCLSLTVLAYTKTYQKIWTEDETPDGTGFCGAEAKAGILQEAGMTDKTVFVSLNTPEQHDSARTEFTEYLYAWNGTTYRFAGKRKMYSVHDH
jgi:hypothetical protein